MYNKPINTNPYILPNPNNIHIIESTPIVDNNI